MPYTVQLDLDAASMAALDGLNARLERVHGLDTVRGLGDVNHLSLAVYDDVPVPEFAAGLERFRATLKPFGLFLAQIGVFRAEESVLFLGPVVTGPLLALHRRFHAAMADFARTCWAHYRPGHWVPHVSLALHAKPGALMEALEQATQHWTPGPARVDALRLIRFHPVATVYHQPF